MEKPKRVHKDWDRATTGQCDCGRWGAIINGLCPECHDENYHASVEEYYISELAKSQEEVDRLKQRETELLKDLEDESNLATEFLLRAEKAEAKVKELEEEADKQADYIRSLQVENSDYLQGKKQSQATAQRLRAALESIAKDKIGYGHMDAGRPTFVAKIAQQALTEPTKPGEQYDERMD